MFFVSHFICYIHVHRGGSKADVPKKVTDTGGGFLLDEEEQEVMKRQKVVTNLVLAEND